MSAGSSRPFTADVSRLPTAFQSTTRQFLEEAAGDAASRGQVVRRCEVSIDTKTDLLTIHAEYYDTALNRSIPVLYAHVASRVVIPRDFF